MSHPQPASAPPPACQRFLAVCAGFACLFGGATFATEDIPVSESTVSTIAAAIATDMGGDAAQYIEYAEKLGITLTTLTRPQQEGVLEDDPGGLLGVLESAPEPTEESNGETGEETLEGTSEGEPYGEEEEPDPSSWEQFWDWLSGLWE